MNRVQVALVAFASLLVTACSGPAFKGDVTRFNKLPPANGASVNVMPADEAMIGSLEFGTYADMLGRHLESQGYQPAGGKPADLIAVVEYEIGDGREKLINRPRVNMGFGYRSRNYSYWGWHDPFAFHDNNEVYARTYYPAMLKVTLRNAETDEVLFEGRVESESRKNALPEIMPYMLQAMFEGFPGANGETRQIVISPPDSE